MPSLKITKRAVDALPATGSQTFVWDTEVKGFGLKVTPAGKRTYVFQYRTGGRETATQRVTIGEHGSPWSPDAARKEALRLSGLARLQGAEIDDQAPEFAENRGYDPVFGPSLKTDNDRARWLADRIREIEAVTEAQLPTIAVLVPNKEMLTPLTAALNEQLSDLSLQAKAYSEGEAIGRDKDVRVFPIEHIKGLEFEAVFFLDVDRLALEEPELFGRYIYVGATRAATFLGLTASGPSLPSGLEHPDQIYGVRW